MLPPLDTLPPGVPDEDRTLGWGILRWSQRLFVQPDGPRAGQPFRPTDRQTRFLLWWYSLDDSGGFVYRHGVRRLSKGSGKSPYAAFLALVEWCGPVRFNGWDSRDDQGNLLGKPVAMPLVQIAATAEHQTANTNRYVREMSGKGTRLQRAFSIEPGKTINYKPGGGELRIITSSSTGAEGAQPSFVVLDETEHHLPSNGGDDLFEVLDRNLAKSNSRMLETCNAWQPGAGSVAEKTWDAFVAQQEGKFKGSTRILYDALEAPADVVLTDDASLIEALTIVYADCPWVDVRAIAERIWSQTTRPEVARRFYLNQRVSDSSSWTTPTKWAALARPEHVVPDGANIVLFFDGSKSGDATALIGCEVETGHIFDVLVIEPDNGAEVDAAEVDRAVQLAFERWSVVAFFADVREFDGYVKTTWPERYADRLVLWAVPSGTPPQPIAWDMRGHTIHFAQAAELCAQEIEDAAFTHDGSSVVARHVGNAQRRPFRQWDSIAKESPKSRRKIDAAVCVIGARHVRRLLLASPEWQRRTRTVDRTLYAF